MVKVKFKRLDDTAITPKKVHPEDAGYDLYACLDYDMVFIPPHQTLKIPTNISMEIPDGYFGAIYARSGLAANNGLRPGNCVGVVDSTYRGNITIALHNDSNLDQCVRNGERIAQLIIQSYLQCELEEVEELSSTERGNGGFGSSGK